MVCPAIAPRGVKCITHDKDPGLLAWHHSHRWLAQSPPADPPAMKTDSQHGKHGSLLDGRRLKGTTLYSAS